MNLREKMDIIIYINMFVHYPETYNSYTIENKFDSYFIEYFSNNKFNDFISNHKCYVIINNAPHQEEESLKIEVYLAKNIDELINKETMILSFKEFTTECFNNQIKDIDIEYV